MSWIIGFLTFVLVINCLLLILLVLIQLPKKEAGMGTAFGGGATDALFGAGSGNALTKMTKYCSGVFFGLTLCLSVLHAQNKKSGESEFEKALEANAPPAPALVVPSNTVPTIDTNFSGLTNALTTTNVASPASVPAPDAAVPPSPAPPVPPKN